MALQGGELLGLVPVHSIQALNQWVREMVIEARSQPITSRSSDEILCHRYIDCLFGERYLRRNHYREHFGR
jgi:hypothetical protein